MVLSREGVSCCGDAGEGSAKEAPNWVADVDGDSAVGAAVAADDDDDDKNEEDDNDADDADDDAKGTAGSAQAEWLPIADRIAAWREWREREWGYKNIGGWQCRWLAYAAEAAEPGDAQWWEQQMTTLTFAAAVKVGPEPERKRWKHECKPVGVWHARCNTTCLLDINGRRWYVGGEGAAIYGDQAQWNVRGKCAHTATQAQHNLAAAAASISAIE
jgi:hypothetical protein